MTTLLEAAQRSLTDDEVHALPSVRDALLLYFANPNDERASTVVREIRAALASEPQAEPVLINGLTEAETSACASVAGLVGQPGAVGLSERQIDLQKIAKQAGIRMDCWDMGAASLAYSKGCRGITRAHLEKFAALYGFACWNAALEANPPHMQGMVSRAIESALATAQPAAPGWTDGDSDLPPAYMLAKLKLVMPVFQEARDALPAITEHARQLRGISATLADRMDEAGTFCLDDWLATQPTRERG